MSTESNTRYSREPIGPAMKNGDFVFKVPHSGTFEEGPELPVNPHLEGERPFSEVIDRLEPVHSPADLDREPRLLPLPHTPEKNSRRGLILGAVGAATAIAVAAGSWFGTRGDDSEPTTPNPNRPTASAGPNPGVSSMSPEISATTSPNAQPSTEVPGGAARQQNEVYKYADVNERILGFDYLEKYDMSVINPSALDVYKGTDTKPGLIPNYQDVMFEHLNALTDATPERIAAASRLISEVVNAKYTRVTDDSQVETGVGAGEMFKDVAFSPGKSMEEFERLINVSSPANNPERRARVAATEFVSSADYFQPALDILATEVDELTTYAKQHPDKASFTPNEITPSTIASLGYLNPARFNLSNDVSLANQRRPLVYDTKAYIAKVYKVDGPVDPLTERVSSDGSTTSHLRAVTIISENTLDEQKVSEIKVTTLVAVPVYDSIREDVVTGKDTIEDVKNKKHFQWVTVYSTVVNPPR